MSGAPDFYFNYIQWFDCDQVTQRLSTDVVTRSKEITIKKEGTRDSLLDREYRQCLSGHQEPIVTRSRDLLHSMTVTKSG